MTPPQTTIWRSGNGIYIPRWGEIRFGRAAREALFMYGGRVEGDGYAVERDQDLVRIVLPRRIIILPVWTFQKLLKGNFKSASGSIWFRDHHPEAPR